MFPDSIELAPSLIALTGFALWTLVLVLALGVSRSLLVMTSPKKANEFKASGDDCTGFLARLTRAHANCYENLPTFAALIAAAGLSNQFATTDPVALWVLYARVGQSVVHMISVSEQAVFVRFLFYGAQVLLMGYMAIALLGLI